MSSFEPIPDPRAPLKELILSNADLQTMLNEVDRLAPEEACGLLIGEFQEHLAITKRTMPITNIQHSTYRYLMAPAEQLAVFNELEKQGLELVGIYHSHPVGPQSPSETDIAEAYYPEVVHLIWSRPTGVWVCSGFLIQNGITQKVALRVSDSS